MRACLAVTLALALAACGTVAPSAGPPDTSDAEAAVRAYVDAFATGDYRGAAERMDPAELDRFVGLVEAMMGLPDAPDDAGPVPQDGPAAFAWFLETMGGMTPGFSDAVQTADADILGAVAEGDSLVHVVMRTRASMMGLDTETVSTTTTRRRDGRWVVALSGNIETMVQAMEQFGGMMSEPMGDDGADPQVRKPRLKPGRDR